ncbi:MAG: DMT family transporter [Rhodocyclales bacterium]|nr:DMT family transporter [Rhodocyclales bacterium]
MAESAPSRTYQRSLSPEQTVGIALALLGTLLLSTKSVIVKSAYAAGSDAEALLAIRMAIALPVYGVIWACLPKGSPLTWREGCSAALIGVLGYGVSSYLDLQGLEYLSASVERLILFTYPLFVAVLGYALMSLPIGARTVQGLLVSYGGLAAVMAEQIAVDTRATLAGALLVLGSAVTFALFQLYATRMVRAVGAMRFTCMAMSAAAAVSVVSALIRRPLHDLVPNSSVAMHAVILAIFGTIVPSFAMSAALKRISAQANSAIGALSPAVTAALAAIFLGERMSPVSMFGAAVMVAGTVWAARDGADLEARR